MFDLALSSTGDIMFTQNKNYLTPLKISFVLSNTKAQKISFEIENCQPQPTPETGIRISFELNKMKNDKRAMLVFGDNALAQAIEYRLLTALGELSERKEIGSTLELLKHKSLHDVKIQTEIKKTVQTAVADILPNAEVRTEAKVISSGGYKQIMAISICDGETVVYKYNM